MNFTKINKIDHQIMANAIKLGAQGLLHPNPNPNVGCILISTIKEKVKIIGQGWHKKIGDNHAEVNAIIDTKINGYYEFIIKSTAYVTLEPCNHYGNTPPCTKILLKEKIPKIIIATLDTNSKTTGGGIKILKKHNILISYPIIKNQSNILNIGYNKRMKIKKSYIYTKIASSIDGNIAMQSGESKWITGHKARNDVQKLRAKSCAIITGSNTIKKDRPKMNIRDQLLVINNGINIKLKQPLHVIINSKLKVNNKSKILYNFKQIIVMYAKTHPIKLKQLIKNKIKCVGLANNNNKIDLIILINLLNKLECNNIMIEGGARLNGSFFKLQLIDDIIHYFASCIIGDNTNSLIIFPIINIKQKST